MTTGLSYDGSTTGTTSFVTQLATMAVVSPTDPNFIIALPMAISYAENRIYRDVDFLSTKSTLPFILTAGMKSLSLSGTNQFPFVVIEQVNIISPQSVTTLSDPAGQRSPCTATSKEYIDAVHGSSAVGNRGLPTVFSLFTDNTLYFGPTPDQNYTAEIVGTARPLSLSQTNLTTFVSLYLPDLFIMASMIYVSAYQRNFSSASSNDPQMPVTYESQYKTLLTSVVVEEARKKFQSSGWSSMTPTATASSSRG